MAAEVKLEKKEELHHPWNLHSIYDLQYFCCPGMFSFYSFFVYKINKKNNIIFWGFFSECTYKVSSSTIHGKQDLINHAYESHPNSVDFLNNIQVKILLCSVIIFQLFVYTTFVYNFFVYILGWISM